MIYVSGKLCSVKLENRVEYQVLFFYSKVIREIRLRRSFLNSLPRVGERLMILCEFRYYVFEFVRFTYHYYDRKLPYWDI